MKIIIVQPNPILRGKLRHLLETERGHVVLSEADTLKDLLTIIAEHEPDLVLLPDAASPECSGSNGSDMVAIRLHFPDCQFLHLDAPLASWDGSPPQSLIDQIKAAEERCRLHRPAARPYADEKRCVIHDIRYAALASPEKLHRPKNSPGWQEQCQREEALFVLQLRTGAADQRHAQAKRYLAMVERANRGFLQEMAYRISHGSYKTAWLREQIARWITVLVHYLPGAEIEHCPAPHSASPTVSYLHHALPVVIHYPMACLLSYKITPALVPSILEATAWIFDGESDEELAAIGCRMLGVNSYLQQVAHAQVRSMEQFLDPKSPFHQMPEHNRLLHRLFGVFFEFWGWHFLYNLGIHLRATTLGHLAGTTRVEFPPGAKFAPTFVEFRNLFLNAYPNSGENRKESDQSAFDRTAPPLAE